MTCIRTHVQVLDYNSERFPERVKETMENCPVDAIDKIIDSMDRRKTDYSDDNF